MMNIGIVTFEFEGITKNGGIGMAYRRLSDLLSTEGHRVTVFLVADPKLAEKSARKLMSALRRQGHGKVRIELVWPPTALDVHCSWFVARSMAVYERLRRHPLDVVHFPDNQGLCYHSLLAKRQGLDFANTCFVVGTHGTIEWVREAHRELPRNPDEIAVNHLEKKCLEFADILVSPSQYMLDRFRRMGWAVPEKSLVIPNVNRGDFPSPRLPRKRAKTAQGLVFFGRLEQRKGIYGFVDALRIYLERHPELRRRGGLDILFLGRDCELQPGIQASEFVRRQLNPYRRWTRLRFEHDLSAEQAHELLRKRQGDLVCMPSWIDNSPYVIVEAIELGLNLLSSDQGGQAELIHPEDRERVLTSPGPAALLRAFEARLWQPPIQVRPSPEAIKANAVWLKLHRALEKRRPARVVPFANPLVSICVQPGPKDRLAIHAAWAQKYPNLEVADTVSQGFEDRVFSEWTGGVGSDQPKWLLRAARRAKGEYLLLIRNARLAHPRAIDLFVQAAEKTDADLVVATTVQTPGRRAHWVVPMYDDLANGMFRHPPQITHLFLQREAFLKILTQLDVSSHTSDSFLGWIYKAIALRMRVICLPRPLIHTNRRAFENWDQWVQQAVFQECQAAWAAQDNAIFLPALTAGLFQECQRLQARQEPRRVQ